MKELDSKDRLNEKTQIESVVQEQKQVEYRHESSLNPLKGHALWEINTKTLEVSKAKFIDEKTISWYEALKMIGENYAEKVAIKLDCVYISALNKENAIKRYKEKKGSATRSEGIITLKELFW